MINKFCKKPLWECSKTLSAVAQGLAPAETVIKGAKLVNVCTAEIQENVDVAIAEGRIAYLGQADHCIGENTQVIDAKGQYIAPGSSTAHPRGIVHDGRGRIRARRRAARHHGIYMDPHEICNVLGLDGVKVMEEDARRTPLKTMITTRRACPPCPASRTPVRPSAGRRGRDDGMAERRGTRRDDELPGHPRKHGPRAWRSGWPRWRQARS